MGTRSITLSLTTTLEVSFACVVVNDLLRCGSVPLKLLAPFANRRSGLDSL